MSIESMVKLFIRGIDFCISEDFPTLEFIRVNFKGKCEQYGAFVDDEVNGRKNAPDTVLNGNCKAMMEYDGFTVSRIFIRHNSQAAVIASDNAMVTIDAFDNSNLAVATAGNSSQIFVNLYGNAQVECIGENIQVKKMNKETY
ncbi:MULTISPECIES: hypothetical protein [unclassified Dysgonomonas]|uniref:hypothetical protein n=1 Tax=unclassified Dysgonomonas TaxID=2630389 RepID=UPI002475AC5F|nr:MULTISPECIES: hypothetical protein [unclassified Dysgonomonas]